MRPNRKKWVWTIVRFSRKLKGIISNSFGFMPVPDFNGQYDDTML